MLSFTISAIRQETLLAKTFFLKPTNHEAVSYKAGQFISFIFTEYGHDVRRSYSISSTPGVDNQISITIKKISNGLISRWFIERAKVGDILNALPPSGMFVIETNPSLNRDIFLIAAGSGITPVFSLLKSILHNEPLSRVTLVYGNSTFASTIFLEQIRSLEIEFAARLKVEWLFSNHQHISQARLGGFLLELLLSKHLRYAKQDALIYTCGPFDFMQMVQIVAFTNGFNKNNVRREVFVDHEETAIEQPYYDETNRTITLIFNKKTYQLLVPYNESILTAALANGIELPYSCRAGRCSTCQCHVKSGRVFMHYNEVLTDADIEKKLALTCTGHPMTEDVVVEIG